MSACQIQNCVRTENVKICWGLIDVSVLKVMSWMKVLQFPFAMVRTPAMEGEGRWGVGGGGGENGWASKTLDEERLGQKNSVLANINVIRKTFHSLKKPL